MSSLLLLISFFVFLADCRSLTDLVCQINPEKCDDFKHSGSRQKEQQETRPFKSQEPHTASSFGAPSLDEFNRWNSYEETAQGTGFLVPQSGNNPVPYGPGLGDIGIFTGVGVQYGVGSLGIQRDFGLAMGGNGRIGGIPVGWGNGGTKTIGSAPWMHP